jgi:excisionase family DNA binding protein
MGRTVTDYSASVPSEPLSRRFDNRMTVEEIAGRLDVGRLAVYNMLERGIVPGIRLGRRWIVTRHAYEQWERTCGCETTLYSSRTQR